MSQMILLGILSSKTPITIISSFMDIFPGEHGHPFLVVPHAGTKEGGTKILALYMDGEPEKKQ